MFLGDIPNIAVQTPLWLALVTTAVGAIEGAVVGRQDRQQGLDIVGIFVFALFLGLGGGFIRDVMIGNTPLVALRTPAYILTVCGAVVVVLIAGRWIPVQGRLFILLDALTLGLYAAIGTQYALDFGLPEVGAVIVGLFASLSGGVIVAILRRQTPSILLPGFPYGLLAFIGVVAYVLLDGYSAELATVVCILSVIILRFVTLQWGVRTKPVSTLPAPGGDEAPTA